MKFNLKKYGLLLIVPLIALAIVLTSGRSKLDTNSGVKQGSFDDFVIYLGGNTKLENTYYKSNGSGGITKTGASADDYNVYWDNEINALTVKDLTLTTCASTTSLVGNSSRSMLVAQKNTTVELDFKVIFQGNVNFSKCHYAQAVWDQTDPYGSRTHKFKTFIMEHQPINEGDQAKFYATYSAGFYESQVKLVNGSFYFDAGTTSEDAALHATEHVIVDGAIVHAKARNHGLKFNISGSTDRLILNGGKLILESIDQPYPFLGNASSFYYYKFEEPFVGSITKVNKKFSPWKDTSFNVVLDEDGNPVKKVTITYLASSNDENVAIYDLELDKKEFDIVDFKDEIELEGDLVENTKVLVNAKPDTDLSKYKIDYSDVPTLEAGEYKVNVTVKNSSDTVLIETTVSIKLINTLATEGPDAAPDEDVEEPEVEEEKTIVQTAVEVGAAVTGTVAATGIATFSSGLAGGAGSAASSSASSAASSASSASSGAGGAGGGGGSGGAGGGGNGAGGNGPGGNGNGPSANNNPTTPESPVEPTGNQGGQGNGEANGLESHDNVNSAGNTNNGNGPGGNNGNGNNGNGNNGNGNNNPSETHTEPEASGNNETSSHEHNESQQDHNNGTENDQGKHDKEVKEQDKHSDKDSKDHDKHDKETKDHEHNDKESKDHDKHDKESKDHDKHDKESKDHDKHDKETKDHEHNDKESKDHDKHDKETKDHEHKDKESKDHDKHDKETKDHEHNDKESKDHDKHDKETKDHEHNNNGNDKDQGKHEGHDKHGDKDHGKHETNAGEDSSSTLESEVNGDTNVAGESTNSDIDSTTETNPNVTEESGNSNAETNAGEETSSTPESETNNDTHVSGESTTAESNTTTETETNVTEESGNSNTETNASEESTLESGANDDAHVSGESTNTESDINVAVGEESTSTLEGNVESSNNTSSSAVGNATHLDGRDVHTAVGTGHVSESTKAVNSANNAFTSGTASSVVAAGVGAVAGTAAYTSGVVASTSGVASTTSGVGTNAVAGNKAAIIANDNTLSIAVISEDSYDNRFANKVYSELKDLDFNVYEDLRHEDLQYKIKNNLETRATICIVVRYIHLADVTVDIHRNNGKDIQSIPYNTVVDYFLKKYK